MQRQRFVRGTYNVIFCNPTVGYLCIACACVCVCVCVWSGKGKNREMMSDDDISIFKAYLFKKKQPTIYTCHTNNNSEQVIGINVKCKTIKLLEDNIEESR